MSECLGRYYDPNNFDCGANVTNAVRNRGCHQSAGGHSCVMKSENSLYRCILQRCVEVKLRFYKSITINAFRVF